MTRHLFALSAALLLLAASVDAQEYRGVSFGIIVSNAAGREQLLVAGVREGATTGIDQGLEEYELPPLPPAEIFDARLVSTPSVSDLGLGSYRDFRPLPAASPATLRYTLSYQAGEGMSGVTLVWDVPYPGRVSKLMIDGQDMTGKTELTTPFMQGQLVIDLTVAMDPLRFTASPPQLMFNANNRDPLPYADVQITPTGDPGAVWQATTNVPWLFLAPASGTGQGSIRVAVINAGLAQGSMSGVITVSSPTYPAQVEIPVQLQVTVGAGETPVPLAMSLDNHPNPVTAAAVLTVDLGGPARDAQLRIHDLLGREVLNLSGRLAPVAGRQVIPFDGRALAPGVYLCRLSNAGQTLTHRLTVTR